MRTLLETTAPPPDDDARFSYWSFADLQVRRIVSTRSDLHRKQRFFEFPKPVILTGGRGASALYRVDLVKAWLVARENLAGKNSAPELKADSRPRGRPRKHPIEIAESAATT